MFQETHYYDSKLKDKYIQYKHDDIMNLQQPIDFVNTLNEIYKKITNLPMKTYTNDAIYTLHLVNKDRINNYDFTNEINFEDLLPRTWRFVEKYNNSAIDIFIEQLSDIILNGRCAQGRVSRIIQFYFNHMESRDEIYQLCKI